MKKILFVLATLLLCLTPALAQRGQRQIQRQPQQQRQVYQRPHVDRSDRAEHRQNFRDNRRDYRGGGHEARDRWDGRRFDHDYFRGHYGRDHVFFWGHCGWYGRPYYVGSRFQYGGAWFVIVDPLPDYWILDDGYYIDEYGDEYYIINPLYPGVRVRVSVYF